MIVKNQNINLDITDITHECNGVGRYDGMAVFVPLTATGDNVEAKIIKVNKNFAVGKLEKINRPSAMRAENECPVYDKCGGCSLRHISYEEELRIKEGWVRENIRRIGGFADFNTLPILPSPKTSAYRNKAQYPITSVDGEIVAGFYAKHSHRVIPNSLCILQPKDFQTIVDEILKFLNENKIAAYDEVSGKGIIRHIYIRTGTVSDEIMVCLVINAKSLPKHDKLIQNLLKLKLNKKIVSIVLNHNFAKSNVILGKNITTLYGKCSLTDVLCGNEFDISPLAFYQVNHAATELLYAEAVRLMELNGNEKVVELYCGAGTITLTIAKYAKEIIAIEIVPEAVVDAKHNAKTNNINNVTFICDDAMPAAKKLSSDGVIADVVVVDPPRKGCDSEVLKAIVNISPKKVVYISCNSATLARDCKYLSENGYILKTVTPVDLFPRTAHVESCALLCKED